MIEGDRGWVWYSLLMFFFKTCTCIILCKYRYVDLFSCTLGIPVHFDDKKIHACCCNFKLTLSQTFSKQRILNSSKLKQPVVGNFKFDENSRKFSRWVENTEGKGEIAHYGQFLLFPLCFQKACFPGASKGVIV